MSDFIDMGIDCIGLKEVGPIFVSTVLLPFHYDSWKYETMVFGSDLDGNCERYQTREDAEKGHAAWVKKVFGEDVK